MARIVDFGSDDIPESASNIKFMVYGPTGSGKTYSLRTLPERMRPALLIDCDRGSRALWTDESLGTAVQFDIEDPESGRPLMYEQTAEFLQTFHRDPEAAGLKTDFKTVVVDSYTVMHQAIMAYVLWKSYKGTSGKGAERRNTTDEPPTLPEYGIITHLAQQFVQALIQLDRNLIVICHEATQIVDEVTGRSRGGPALPPKLAQSMPRYFDEILYSATEGKGDNRRYIWTTRTTGLFEARSRHPDLAAEIPQDYGIYV